jgi:ABC-type lipoprotein release transport system permease subunit
MWFFTFAFLQLRARWQSLITLMVGVLLAALIGANAPLYTSATASVGLVEYLADQDPAQANVYIRTTYAPVDVDDFDATRIQYNEAIEQTNTDIFGASDWKPTSFSGAETQAMFALQNGEDIPNVELRIAHYDALQNMIDVVDGQFPVANADLNNHIPVALHVDAATRLNLKVGDTLAIDQRGWDSSQIFTVEIVALIREQDPTASYWLAPSPLRVDVQSRGGLETNLLTTRTFFTYVAEMFIPQPSVNVNWRWLFPHNQVSVTGLDNLSAQVNTVEDALKRAFNVMDTDASSVVVQTGLPDMLASYGSNIDLLNIPTGLILLQLGALVFFFLIVIATLVRRDERREIALLQSRGAHDQQILLIKTVEAIIICVMATFTAPFIARALLTILVPLFTGISDISLTIDATVFVYAGGASILALLVLIATVRPVLRLPLIQAGGAATRSQSQTWWQQYYVDVVLMVGGILALSQLSPERFLVTAADGSVQADPLLLLAPALLFVSFSSVMLRVIPVLMDGVSRIVANGRGLVAVLATWQVSREPLHYGRITFLLALAIGVGSFALTYQSTTQGNDLDQALYTVGADARIVFEQDADLADIERITTAMQNADGIAGLSMTKRLLLPSISVGSRGRGQGRQTGVLLGVDATTIAEVGYTRADLNAITPPPFAGDLPETGRALPANIDQISVQMRLDARVALDFQTTTEAYINSPQLMVDYLRLFARVRDEAGTIYSIPLEPDTRSLEEYFEAVRAEQGENANVGSEALTESEIVEASLNYPDDGWLSFTADVTAWDTPLPANLSLDALVVRSDKSGFSRRFAEARVTFAGLEVVDDAGTTTLDWLRADEWSFANELFAVADAPEPATIRPLGNTGTAMTIEYAQDAGSTAVFGIMLRYPERTTVQNTRSHNLIPEETTIVGIPALVSRSFAEANELVVGQRFRLFFENLSPWFEVTNIIDYYPTLYQETPYIIVDRDVLLYTINRQPRPITLLTEVWVHGTDTAVQATTSETAISEVMYTSDLLAQKRTDTLTLSIIGLLYLSFVIGMALSVVSLFTYVSLSVRARRAEFAVLQAMGYPRHSVFLMLVIEQSLVLLAALVLGAIISFFLSVQVLPPLIIGAAGGAVTPPTIVQYDVDGLLLFAISIVVVMGVVLLLSAGRVWRSSTMEALRFDGE